MPRKTAPRDIPETVVVDFPDPTSVAGQLLGALISAHIPGMRVSLDTAALAVACAFSVGDVEEALQRLAADNIVYVERDVDGAWITVVRAPTLDEYGVVAVWAGDDLRDPEPPASAVRTDGQLSESARGRVRVVERSTFEEAEATRSFLDRFERLLTECDEWRRRAIAAEERLGTLERHVRTVERRAEGSQTRLDVATDRLRAWSEFSRRMHQLTRQADALARTRTRLRENAPADPIALPEPHVTSVS